MKKFGEAFREQFYALCKAYNIKPIEAKSAVRSLFEELYNGVTPRYFGIDYNLQDSNYQDFSKLQESIVQQCIDFIKNHPKIQKELGKKKEELIKEWNESSDFPIVPDTRIYFGIDGMEESIKEGSWVPSTDSFLNLCVSNVSVLNVM